MKILSIQKNKINETESRLFSIMGMEKIAHEISGVKFMAPLRLSKIIDKNEVDIVEVKNIADAMIALSSVQLTKKQTAKVVINLSPNSDVPRGIPSEICKKVALWIFPSQRLLSVFQQIPDVNFCKTSVVAPTNFDELSVATKNEGEKYIITRVGQISDTALLRSSVDAFDELCKKNAAAHLRICGEGRPEDVMPVVRHSRYLMCADRITWTGADYNLSDEIAISNVCVSSANDITNEETLFIVNGIDIIDPEQIANLPEKQPIKNLPKENYEPCFHVKQLQSLYNSII